MPVPLTVPNMKCSLSCWVGWQWKCFGPLSQRALLDADADGDGTGGSTEGTRDGAGGDLGSSTATDGTAAPVSSASTAAAAALFSAVSSSSPSEVTPAPQSSAAASSLASPSAAATAAAAAAAHSVRVVAGYETCVRALMKALHLAGDGWRGMLAGYGSQVRLSWGVAVVLLL